MGSCRPCPVLASLVFPWPPELPLLQHTHGGILVVGHLHIAVTEDLQDHVEEEECVKGLSLHGLLLALGPW